MRATKRCECGKTFETSPAGVTVRCPECRAARRERTAGTARFTTHGKAAHAGRTCTVVVGVGRKCGKVAVTAFTAHGETFAECAEHAAPGAR